MPQEQLDKTIHTTSIHPRTLNQSRALISTRTWPKFTFKKNNAMVLVPIVKNMLLVTTRAKSLQKNNNTKRPDEIKFKIKNR